MRITLPTNKLAQDPKLMNGLKPAKQNEKNSRNMGYIQLYKNKTSLKKSIQSTLNGFMMLTRTVLALSPGIELEKWGEDLPKNMG